MKAELSALLDGELEQHQTPAVLAALRTDESLRDDWADYQLIGDALRGEPGLQADLTSRVMRALMEEPVVLAPARRRTPSWQGAAMALAASVAGVAVVAWLGLTPHLEPHDAIVVAKTERPVAAIQGSAGRGLQEYLLAHQASAPGLHMQGGAQHIRTVSATGGR